VAGGAQILPNHWNVEKIDGIPARPIMRNKANSEGRDCRVAALLAMTDIGEESVLRNKANLKRPAWMTTPLQGKDYERFSRFAGRAKQSQFEGSFKCQVGRARRRVCQLHTWHFKRTALRRQYEQGLLCETKPICPAGAWWARPTLQERLRRHCAKQSQFIPAGS